MTQNFQCSNEEDLFGNKFNTKSDNLIIFKITDNNFICMTRYELSMIIKEYTEKPAIVQSQNPNEFKRGEEDRENKLNPENYFYQIPYTGMWVDYTFKKMYDEKINTIKLVKMPNDVVLMRSVPGIVSGMHDYKTGYYKAEKIPRSELFGEERKDIFNSDEKIDEVELDEEEIKEVKIRCENIKKLSFSPDGKFIVTLDSSRILTVWNVETQEKIHSHRMGYDRNNDSNTYGRTLIWSPDGSYIAVSDTDDFKRETYLNMITLFKPDLTYIKSIEVKMEITTFNLSKDGKYIACGGQNGEVRVYSSTGKKITQFKLNGPIKLIEFLGQYISCCVNNKIYIWDIIHNELNEEFTNSSNFIYQSADRHFDKIACLDSNNNLIFLSTFMMEELGRIHFEQNFTRCLYLYNERVLLFGKNQYGIFNNSIQILGEGTFLELTISKDKIAFLTKDGILIKNI